MNDIRLFQLNCYVRPKIVEVAGKDWVLNGRRNGFYQEIIDAYRYSDYNHENNIVRGLKEEADRWLKYKEDAAQQLLELGVNPDDL